MPFIVDLLLFVLCLSILIVVHELGHLCAAKAFNVYCFEFSVGFGPALFRRKRKNGETYIAIRGIPFGGFVSMYGEENGEIKDKENTLPDGIENIPEHRSLAKIKKWKKAIILVAGVTLNALLALLVFFVSNGPWFAQQQISLNQIEVSENSVASSSGLNVGLLYDNVLAYEEVKVESDSQTLAKNSLYILSYDSVIYYKDSTNKEVAALYNLDTATWSFKNRSFDNHVIYYSLNDDGTINFDNQILPNEDLTKVSLNFALAPIVSKTQDGKEIRYADYENKVEHTLTLKVEFDGTNHYFESTGISALLHSYRYNFFEAIGQSFVDFGQASTSIVRALGSLFTPKGIQQVGGPVAIFTQSSKMLSDFGICQFLDLWGIISVNLAIFNLIPFPGLDGWQLLVLGIESISRKKMNTKVQQIVSFVGMVILFAFMAFILIKDVIGLF
jgi:regulator of sigma E protease